MFMMLSAAALVGPDRVGVVQRNEVQRDEHLQVNGSVRIEKQGYEEHREAPQDEDRAPEHRAVALLPHAYDEGVVLAEPLAIDSTCLLDFELPARLAALQRLLHQLHLWFGVASVLPLESQRLMDEAALLARLLHQVRFGDERDLARPEACEVEDERGVGADDRHENESQVEARLVRLGQVVPVAQHLHGDREAHHDLEEGAVNEVERSRPRFFAGAPSLNTAAPASASA
eukprot:CAMPEP_0185574664 /NCGR_PEP_ID=MMETSP0434-20130131/6076_1 /TAXON_ID=626734 ORGANISM="Favella taraikaensis, Strain Fe Narragansett Bay" /NCGR_SAMPLE_ID=MMETSP0434 /ASSEMBLY_ACC=CAM_ASM_000379 /LENGTH=229 /DNA_ID=CAMNT_0028191313 /DNA_START=600 /DNA_END=1285 /DNA_ORIENTATION=-